MLSRSMVFVRFSTDIFKCKHKEYEKSKEKVFKDNTTSNKSVISVEDLAVAVVDELEKPKHIRRRFTVAY